MSIHLSSQEYWIIGLALIVTGIGIHHSAVMPYLRARGVVREDGRNVISHWKAWSAYRNARLSDHQPLMWWYVLWVLQIVAWIWMIGWFAVFAGVLKFGVPIYPTPAPNSSGYTTFFDVTQTGFRQWWFSAFGLFFVAYGLAEPTLIRRGVVRKSPSQKYPGALLGFAILWTTISFTASYSDYRAAMHAMRSNEASFVEGTVTEFVSRSNRESFVVQGVRFKYSDHVITAGFNNTASKGGPIREGLPVRIWYQGNEILRLDIAFKRDQPQAVLTPSPVQSSHFDLASLRY